MARILALLVAALGSLPATVARGAEDFVIGHLELEGDPRYRSKHTYARFLAQPLGRPFAGAEVALGEVKFHGAGAGVGFKLSRKRARDAAGAVADIDALAAQGVRFFILDLPGDTLAEVAAATRGRDIVLLNASAGDDRLRGEQCQPHLLHVLPSDAMLMDALAQYLVFRKWTEALALVGPSAADRRLAGAFERASKRYGVKISERRDFELGRDPRNRERNNVALLTAGADYDVVFVADADGEFARDVPYQTVRPRPVVGSEGLAAAAWHWAWERHGAPQLEKRFEKAAGRPMKDVDWAAWLAVKIVAEAVQRTASADFATLRAYLLDEALIVDGFKGHRSNFRPWDRQLRQPVLLVTHNWVVERAPIRGFLHKDNNLDTLGHDRRESACRL